MSSTAAHAAADSSVRLDASQAKVAERLDVLARELGERSDAKGRKGLLSAILKPEPSVSPRGVYLWGDVGRGKSMLMDAFFAHAPEKAKRRVHFHAFMLEVHARIHVLRQQKVDDQVTRVAREIAKETRLLCFDEFQVHDVADAMILRQLFTTLLDLGVVVVATSNRPPENLYQGGLQRESFLPFIGLLEERLDILHLTGETDYRRKQRFAVTQVYRYPLNAASGVFLRDAFARLEPAAPEQPASVHVHGRTLTIARAKKGVAWMTFHQLCGQPLAAADYIALAKRFPVLLLADIPVLTPDRRNEAKRFVTLIDVLYEHKVKLICTAAAAPDRLYLEGDGSFEFQRTASRLIEMQSANYVNGD